MRRMLRSIAPLLALCLVAAAPAPTSPQPLSGEWATKGFALRTAPTGFVVQGKCASGKIPTPIYPDSAGNFAVSGYFNPYSSGYRLADVAPRDTPARFKGKVAGNKLALTMQQNGKPDATFLLIRGAPSKFAPCP